MESQESRPRLWVSGDWNGFFGLFTNHLTNVLVTVSLLAGVLAWPNDLVFGTIVPGLVLSIAIGNFYYAYQGWRLGQREGRGTVTAVPYGVSVPHYFLVVFAVMLPLYLSTNDPLLAWGVGVAWSFVHGIIAIIGAFIGPTMRRLTPRAAMLGTLAGVAITFIAMSPAFQVWEVAWIGMVSLGIILVGWLAGVQLPGNIPAGLAAILVGTILGWVTGFMRLDALQASLATFAVGIPLPRLQPLLIGLPRIVPYLVTAVPLAIYLFLESLNNVESAEAAGDSYSTRETMLVAGIGTLIGSLFGSPFPTLVYIGHPGWKSVGARVGYSWASGLVILLLGVLGLLPILLNIIPLVAILPLLIYIGLLITSQAFTASPARHAPAVALALIPWIANFVQNQVDSALGAAGTNAADVTAGTLRGAGVYYTGMVVLGSGPILVGMILAAIAAFIIDKNWRAAIGYALFGAACSFFGIIHATELGIGVAWGATIGYLAVALIALFMMLYRGETAQVPESQPVATQPETGASGK
ncbi:MAG TPA: xanthine permease [Chloroflexi bacterium]|jgi:AGZA family xanthine/uracil permease-like MFS transporter|nr:xanthine permease [Chloroflexota bacterium]